MLLDTGFNDELYLKSTRLQDYKLNTQPDHGWMDPNEILNNPQNSDPMAAPYTGELHWRGRPRTVRIRLIERHCHDGMSVIFLRFLSVGSGRDNWDHDPIQNGLTKLLGIVPFVSNHVPSPVTGDQLMGLGNAVLLSSGQQEPQGIAQSVHAHVDFGAETAAAPALGLLSPFPAGAPAARGRARTTVLSMMRCSRPGLPAKWCCICSQMPWSAQRENRLYTLFQFLYSDGNRRHWEPERVIHSTASMKRHHSAS